MNSKNLNTEHYSRFVGLIMALIVPGTAHVLSGQWKTGIVWFCGLHAIVASCAYILSLPAPLSFTAVVAIELFFATLFFIYFVSLCISSYRPTRRLGYRAVDGKNWTEE
jgi:hypothetical protein